MALAILQEELGEAGGSLVSKDGKKLGDHAARIKSAYPLPLPPPKFVHAGKGDDKRTAEVPKVANSSDKLVALKAYRRAQGLCYVCAENGLLLTSVQDQYSYMLFKNSSVFWQLMFLRVNRMLILPLV